MAFQRKPVRGRARVTELFPLALQRQSTEHTMTAINRIVHAACHGDTAADADDVRARIELVLATKGDETVGAVRLVTKMIQHFAFPF